jgi:hypothetical protein
MQFSVRNSLELTRYSAEHQLYPWNGRSERCLKWSSILWRGTDSSSLDETCTYEIDKILENPYRNGILQYVVRRT